MRNDSLVAQSTQSSSKSHILDTGTADHLPVAPECLGTSNSHLKVDIKEPKESNSSAKTKHDPPTSELDCPYIICLSTLLETDSDPTTPDHSESQHMNPQDKPHHHKGVQIFTITQHQITQAVMNFRSRLRLTNMGNSTSESVFQQQVQNHKSQEKESGTKEQSQTSKAKEAGVVNENATFLTEIKVQMANLALEFAGETTAHGYKRTTATHRGRLGKIFWGLAIFSVAATVAITLRATNEPSERQSFSSTIQLRAFQSLPFPAVTVCNLIPYDSSGTNFHNGSELIRLFQYQVSTLDRLPYNFSTIPEALKNITTQDVDEAMGWKLDKFIKKCYWNDEFVPCEDMSVRSLTGPDACFTFNSKRTNLKVSDRVGSFSGLGLFIDLGNSDSIVKATGIKVILHDPEEFPNPRAKGMLVAPGTTAHISVTRDEYKYLPKPYMAYGTVRCSDDPADNADAGEMAAYYNVSGYSGCCARCRLRYIIKSCECVVSGGDPVIPHVPPCDLEKFVKCYIPALRHAYKVSYYNATNCTCALPCSWVRYSGQLSTAAFPESVDGKIFHDYISEVYIPENKVKNYIHLKVFYEELFTHHEEHLEKYTWVTIFGTVGGQVSLFTGASVLTLLEFIELALLTAWLVFCVAYKRIARARKCTRVQNQPSS